MAKPTRHLWTWSVAILKTRFLASGLLTHSRSIFFRRNIRWIKATGKYKLPAMITKQTTASKLAAYLHHEITLENLVGWAEQALMDGELIEHDAQELSSILARLGAADMRAFGLTWEDCENLLHQLGYSAHVEVAAV